MLLNKLRKYGMTTTVRNLCLLSITAMLVMSFIPENKTETIPISKSEIIPGAHRTELYMGDLQGRVLGLVTNQTGRSGSSAFG